MLDARRTRRRRAPRRATCRRRAARRRRLTLDALALHGRRAPCEIGGWWMDDVWDYVRHLVADARGRHPDARRAMLDAERRAARSAIGDHAGVRRARAPSWSRACASTRPTGRSCSAPARTCRRSRGSSARSTSASTASSTTDRIAASSIGDTCKVHGEVSNDDHSRPLEQGARRLRRALDARPLGEPRRGHDHEQPEEHLRHRCSCGRRRRCATRACSSSARCSATTRRPGSALRLTTGCVLGAGANVFGSEMPPKAVRAVRVGRAGARSRRIASTSSSRRRSAMMARRHVDARAIAMRATAARVRTSARWSVEP